MKYHDHAFCVLFSAHLHHYFYIGHFINFLCMQQERAVTPGGGQQPSQEIEGR
jgi:hypothetical protein